MNAMERYMKHQFDGKECPTCSVALEDISDQYRRCPKCMEVFFTVRYGGQVLYCLPGTKPE